MSGPIVIARDLTQVYPVGRTLLSSGHSLRAVRGVSFEIRPGRTLAVVGESGSGKSTLARIIALIDRPASGTLAIDGIDTATTDTAQMARLRPIVQMVFQNPYGSLNPRRRIGAILGEPLRNHTALRPDERQARVHAMLARVGLRPEHYDRYPHMFSGGQRQRIAIARALIIEPTLVVADEPVSALDVSIQAQVLNLLQDLQLELGQAYLFISHDLSVVRHIGHEILVLYLGTPMEQGSKEAIFSRPLHPYTKALLASTPRTTGIRGGRVALKGELPSPFTDFPGCVFGSRCPHAEPRCRAETPQLREVRGRRVACHFAEQLDTDPDGR